MPVDTNRVRTVFLAAVEMVDPAERTALLDRECGEDRALRQRVEALLRANLHASDILDQPTAVAWDEGPLAERAEGPPTREDVAPAASPGQDPERTPNLHGKGTDRKACLAFLGPAAKPEGLGRLGHYEVLEVLGQGGFGIVLKAFDEKLHRVVAVKVLSPALAATSSACQRFVREARAAAALRHDHVVRIYAVEEQPTPYLVMEYIPGQTLQQRLDATGRLDLRDVLRLGVQVARGLAAAHEKGLVHRDIKPANILIETGVEERARLTDFGLARANDDASLSYPGILAGTPLYMAPEQARCEQVDQRSDLFSLGSVLYVMASGEPPFRAETPLAVLQRVNQDTPRAIREIVPEVPEWLCDIIARLHAKEPARRYQSAREVADVLSERLAGLPERGERTDRSRAPSAVPRRARWWRWAALALLLLVLGLGITELTGLTHWLSRPGRGPEGPPKAPGDRPAEGALPARFTNSLDMPFALISRGKFRIGGSGGVRGKEEVDIPYDFYLGVYEVRQGDWESVLGKDKNLSRFSRTGNNRQQVADVPDELLKRFPVDGVSWDDCQEFIKVLNERTKEKGWKYRLPRSEEWEYACRGGPLQTAEDDGFDFYLDRPTNTLAADRANFKDTRLNRPRPVGSYAANRLGLYDMHGNVFELCEERKVDEGNMVRKLRGGCWADHDELCRANHVGLVNHSDRFTGSGLRLARVPIDADR